MKQLAILFLLFAGALFAGQEPPPDWAREAATRALPTYPPQAETATLMDERRVNVSADGSTTSEVREAIKILTPEGRGAAAAYFPYYPKVTRIRGFKAWLITADGQSKTFGKNEIADIAAKAGYELYSDVRAQSVRAENATPGTTFAWSAEVEDQPLYPHIAWYFQHRDPVVLSRLVVTLPSGWEAKAVTFNHDPIEATVDGNTYTWQLTDLPHIKRESASPHMDSLAPWIGVTYYQTSNASAQRDWKAISIDQTRRDEPQAAASAELAAQVKQLTAGQTNLLVQIRAMGRFVQNIKYVEIATDLAHGGGYLPHPAADVLDKRYGDCKDKANLMRTMLRQIGVQSYMVALYYGDRDHVHPEWASAQQFNHMILAISVPESISLPSTMEHPTLGKLLLFDATDPYTPVGLLPEPEQGSWGLLLAGEKGGAVQLPVAPPDTNRTDVAVEGTLSQNGALSATLLMKQHAAAAWRLRLLKERQEARFDDVMRAWLQRNVKELDSDKMDATDSFDSGEMDLHFDFTAPRYAQVMQGRMLVFRPSIVEPIFGFPLQTEKRKSPLVVNGESYHKEVHVKLPAEFKVDEIPEAAAFTASFGKYSASCQMKGDEVVFTEDLQVTATTIPAERYNEAREFYGKIVGAERAPLVLVKD